MSAKTITLTADMLGLEESSWLFDATVVALAFRQNRAMTEVTAKHAQTFVRTVLVAKRDREAGES